MPAKRDLIPDRADSHFDYTASRLTAHKHFESNHYDLRGILEWPVGWGDQDSLQHVNNAVYNKWIDTAGYHYMTGIYEPLTDEPEEITTYVVRDVAVKYRQPTTFPDTVLIATRPSSVDEAKSTMNFDGALWSLKIGTIIATFNLTLVIYDLENKTRAPIPRSVFRVLNEQISKRGVKAKL